MVNVRQTSSSQVVVCRAGSMETFNKNLKVLSTLLVYFAIICQILCAEVPRPRGVSLSRASLYNPSQNFVCFDNSKTIPFSQVNDDYCDCPDASDEPGTSACPHGIFHCTNAGHKPLNLPSSRVNDGICDCCDGTDEYANSKVSCSDVCLQMGRHAREEAQRLAELIKEGKQLKAELSQRGIQLKQHKKDKLVELQKNKEEAVKIKNEKQSLKDEIEVLENHALEHYRKLEEEEKKKKSEAEAAKNREEAVETFSKFDSNQDGVIDISELQTRQTFDKDKNGEVSVEEAQYFLGNEEAVDIEKFLEVSWPNIKSYQMMDAGMFKPPVPETSQGEAEDMGDDQHEEDEGQDEEADEEEDNEEPESYNPEEQHVEESSSITYDDETQKLVDQAVAARNSFAQAEKSVKDIENEIKDINEYLEKDFGLEEEFATLQGECFEYYDHEYVYRLCPFDKTTQQPKSGSAETRLGTWGKWNGPEENKYEAMMYDRGQSCWNGPQRSSQVRLSCGTENKVTAVSEPNRCEYLFEFTTPAVCTDLNGENGDDLHDEL